MLAFRRFTPTAEQLTLLAGNPRQYLVLAIFHSNLNCRFEGHAAILRSKTARRRDEVPSSRPSDLIHP